jgi:fibronectin-binding autotransporter adhesin
MKITAMKNHKKSKHSVQKSLAIGSSGLCLLFAVLANNAQAANSQYFTTAVANGGSYSWDADNWSTISASSPFASPWIAGDFARINGGAGDTYTVTVNASESMAGLYDDNTGTANNLVIADAGSGTGSLNITATGDSPVTQNGFTWAAQGFLTAANTVTITATIAGSGGVEEEAGGGHLQMYGNNTFTGGFLADSSSTFIDYNQNNSFGTGQIGFDNTTFAIMENTGTGVVIGNNVQTMLASGVNFIGNSVTYTGNWYLGGSTYAISLRNNGVGTTVALNGVLSATSGAVTFSGANGGIISLGGQNTYTGTTTVGVSGDANFTLLMGTANALANSSSLILAGGKFSAGGFSQTMHTLGMTVSSTLAFGATSGTALSFTGPGAAWTASTTLNLSDWQGNNIADGGTSTDTLQIGTTSTALTSAELADIEFDGNASTKGLAALDANGYVEELPEPPTILLGLAGGLSLLWRARRRTA